MLGERLRMARRRRRLTQAQVAALVHVSDATINRYERGKSDPDTEMLGRLADNLGVSTDYLLGLTSDKDRHSLAAYLPHLSPEDRDFVLKEAAEAYIIVVKDAYQTGIDAASLRKVVEAMHLAVENARPRHRDGHATEDGQGETEGPSGQGRPPTQHPSRGRDPDDDSASGDGGRGEDADT